MKKLWLWKNSTPKHPHEFWAFNTPYPLDANGDPLVMGVPVGYALFKESDDGSAGRTEADALRGIDRAVRYASPDDEEAP